MDAATLWGLVASIVSVLLGVLAFVISLYFFVHAKRSEQEVSNSLTKIETQAEMLQRITGRQLDRLTKYVTEQPPRPPDPHLEQLMAVLVQVAQPLAEGLARDPTRQTNEQLLQEIANCYIAINYYAALTNFWAQFHLPSTTEFDVNNQFHTMVRRVIDQSAADVGFIEGLLARGDPNRVRASPLSHLLEETTGLWRTLVKTSTDVYIARSKPE